MYARRRQFTLALVSVIGVFAACEPPANAQDYPARPVKIIVPYPAGGLGMDMMARVIAQKLSEGMGGRFYVENLPGAGGTIGTGTAANAPKDGHTILFANQDIVVQAVVKSKIPYDPFKSFTPVIEIAAAPEMIVVHPSLPVKNMQELFALLKANPGKYSYASPGYGTSPHLACEWLFKLTYGLDVVHVPFQGAQAVTATLAGQAPILHITVPLVSPYIKEGTLRPLAVASRARSPAIPDVPTLEEGRGRRARPRNRILVRRPRAGRHAQGDRRAVAAPYRRDRCTPRDQGTSRGAWLRSGRRHVRGIHGVHQNGIRQMEKGC